MAVPDACGERQKDVHCAYETVSGGTYHGRFYGGPCEILVSELEQCSSAPEMKARLALLMKSRAATPYLASLYGVVLHTNLNQLWVLQEPSSGIPLREFLFSSECTTPLRVKLMHRVMCALAAMNRAGVAHTHLSVDSFRVSFPSAAHASADIDELVLKIVDLALLPSRDALPEIGELARLLSCDAMSAGPPPSLQQQRAAVSAQSRREQTQLQQQQQEQTEQSSQPQKSVERRSERLHCHDATVSSEGQESLRHSQQPDGDAEPSSRRSSVSLSSHTSVPETSALQEAPRKRRAATPGDGPDHSSSKSSRKRTQRDRSGGDGGGDETLIIYEAATPFTSPLASPAKTRQQGASVLAASSASPPAAHMTAVADAQAGKVKPEPVAERLYALGNSLLATPDQATQLYQEAETLGHPRATAVLGWLHSSPCGPIILDREKAAEKLSKAVMAGDAFASVCVHYLKQRPGLGVVFAEAALSASRAVKNHLTVLRREAEQDTWANYGVALCLDYGLCGNAANVPKAEAIYKREVERNNPHAVADLGNFYAEGRGGRVDQAAAVSLYIQAATLEVAEAVNNLAFCYEKGEGVPQDSERAFELYQRAAESGLGQAQYNLGCCYYQGLGCEQDLAEAARWFRYASEQENAGAQLRLAECFLAGDGVGRDEAEGRRWLERAARSVCDPETVAAAKRLLRRR